MRKLHGSIGTFAVLVLALAAGITPAEAVITAPEHTFYGRASVDGTPLFAGTILATNSPGTLDDCPATCDTGCPVTPVATFTVPPDPPVDYIYVLRVPIDVGPLTPGLPFEGQPACFYINGQFSGSAMIGARGEATRFDLDPTPTPGLSINDVELFEGDAGATAAVFTVTVEPPAIADILVEYRTEDDTATAGDTDYTTETDTLILAASIGSPLSTFDISIDVMGDGAEEPDETFIVRLVDVENARNVDDVGRGTIRDDDAPVKVSVGPTTAEESEGTAIFTVSLSRVLGVPVTVTYSTENGTGTATPGEDYTTTTGDVTVPAGLLSETFSVPVLTDASHEPNETFFVELSAPVNASLDPVAFRGQGTIRDDERFLVWIQAERDGQGGVEGLDTAVASAVSADGRHVYVAGQFDNAIGIFDRAPDGDPAAGELSFLDFVEDETGTGFVEIRGITAIAVSPDDDYVYAASSESNTVTVFDRSQLTGLLSVAGVAKQGVDEVDGLDGASALAFSPDPAASHLYVASSSSKSLAVFDRDELSGGLSQVETLVDGIFDVDGLAGVAALAMAPEGDHLYAASYLENGVARFDRNSSTGELTFDNVVRDGDTAGGVVDGVAGAQGVAISPDGEHVYVAGRGDHALAVFDRDTDDAGPTYGDLTFLEAEFEGSGGVEGLEGASSVRVSNDGKFVYSTGFQSDAVTVFARDFNPGSPQYGHLTFIETRRNSEVDVEGVGRPTSVAVSPNDREIYVTGSLDDAVAVFVREREAPANPDSLGFTFSHLPNVWTADPTIAAGWSGAVDNDGGAGLGAYSYQFIISPPGGAVDDFVDVEHGVDPQAIVSDVLPDGAYNFHMKTCDRAANCAAELVVPGPFLVDTTPPAGPNITGASLAVDVFGVTWDPSPDGTGSGLTGYTACFDTVADTDCSACDSAPLFDVTVGSRELPPATTTAMTPPLDNDTWYFHICPTDLVGNTGATVHVEMVVDLCRDSDGDGFGSQPNTTCPNVGTDCDDASPAVTIATAYYQDSDGDGFGDAAVSQVVCVPDPGFVADNTDCDDSSGQVNPGRLEDCDNGVSDNCNADVDGADATCLPGCTGQARDLDLGWNFIGPRIDVGLNASQFCGKVLDVGAPSAPEIDEFINANWNPHICGFPFNNFGIAPGSAYFVNSKAPTRWCEEGSAVSSPLAIRLVNGWTAVSLPEWTDGAYLPSDACDEINIDQGGSVREIDRYLNGNWVPHICGFPFNNDPLIPGEGYFVRADAASTWSVVTPPPAPMQSEGGSDTTLGGPGHQGEPLDFAEVEPTGGASRVEVVCESRAVNIRDQTFTVVWGTDRDARGSVRYGTNPEELIQSGCDVRDTTQECDQKTATHFVEVVGLEPDTTYWVQVLTDGRAHAELLEVTTGPILAVPPSDTTFGPVIHAGSPVDGAYVCANVEDLDNVGSSGASATVCDLIEDGDAGYWVLNLGSLRTSDLQQGFAYSANGDQVNQQVCGTTLGCTGRSIDTGTDSPAAQVELTDACVGSDTLLGLPDGEAVQEPQQERGIESRLERVKQRDDPASRQNSRSSGEEQE